MPRCKNPNCKDKFIAKYFLQKHCMEKEECIKLEIEMKKATIWKEKRKEWKVNTHSKEHRKYLQDEINKLARMIDAKFYNDCIDCGKPYGDNKIDACHLISRKKNSSLKWNLHNLHGGHSQCNVFNENHESAYKEGLKKRYGIEYLEMVENLPVQYREIKLSNQEVHDKLTIVRKLNRDIDTYKFENAIAARNLMNQLIGIYN